VPDATGGRPGAWAAKAIDKLFARVDAALKIGASRHGWADHHATVVGAQAAQYRGREGSDQGGRVPEEWKPKARQKDRDARWSIKYSKAKVREGADPKAAKPVDLAIPMFGYKNHIGIDKAHG
jgi:hypothetical protein